MALFPLSAIWGLGYIHFIQGSTPKGMIFAHILIAGLSVCWIFIVLPSVHLKAYLDRFLSPAKVAQAPEEA